MKRNTKGFTLIELLIVVVIIGILAAIAIPKFAATKEKAYIASMKTDLKNLATAQEGYASSNAGVYLTHNWATSADTASGFAPTKGNGVNATLVAGPPAGWYATATNTSTSKKCYIYVGNKAGAPALAVDDAAPACDP
jgi:prepilin-type N-terminal cleavage/methylation domain-containing protein